MQLTEAVRLRSAADNDTAPSLTIDSGKVARLNDYQDGWYQVTFGQSTGYIPAEYAQPVHYADYEGASATNTVREELIAYAYTYLGTPYVYGGSSYSGTDCSGFTMAVFAKFGYSLSHGASDQYYTATSVSSEGGRPVIWCFSIPSAASATWASIWWRSVHPRQLLRRCEGQLPFTKATTPPAIWGPDASSPEASHRDILREPPAGSSLTFSFASVYSVFLFIFAAFPLCNSLLSSVIFSPEASSLHDSLSFCCNFIHFALDFYSSPLYHNHILRNTRSLPSTRPPAQAAQRIQSEV